jgi:hypothetical protein
VPLRLLCPNTFLGRTFLRYRHENRDETNAKQNLPQLMPDNEYRTRGGGIVHVGMVTPLAGSRKKSRRSWALLPRASPPGSSEAGGAVDRPALAAGANPTEFLVEAVRSQRPCGERCPRLP